MGSYFPPGSPGSTPTWLDPWANYVYLQRDTALAKPAPFTNFTFDNQVIEGDEFTVTRDTDTSTDFIHVVNAGLYSFYVEADLPSGVTGDPLLTVAVNCLSDEGAPHTMILPWGSPATFAPPVNYSVNRFPNMVGTIYLNANSSISGMLQGWPDGVSLDWAALGIAHLL